MVAGKGGKQDGYKKECAEQNTGFGGQFDERTAGGHENSPHLMIRIARL